VGAALVCRDTATTGRQPIAAAFSDDRVVADAVVEQVSHQVPRIPASAGALIFDQAGRLLILKPNYKKGWTVPGGQIDSCGESPWEACRRETREECGLQVEHGRLVCVDFLRPKPNRPGGVRFLFHCGVLTDRELSAIRLQEEEIDAHRFVARAAAMALLSGPLRRRLSAVAGTERCVYLEDGRPVPTVKP
jgi:8-oxo-dGTP diphosphatase